MMEVISVAQAKKLEDRKDVLILDLRMPKSYARYHIKKAVNYPFEAIEDRDYCLPLGYTIILYCEKGGLSLVAARMLEQDGFPVKTVMGGMQEYIGTV